MYFRLLFTIDTLHHARNTYVPHGMQCESRILALPTLAFGTCRSVSSICCGAGQLCLHRSDNVMLPSLTTAYFCKEPYNPRTLSRCEQDILVDSSNAMVLMNVLMNAEAAGLRACT